MLFSSVPIFEVAPAFLRDHSLLKIPRRWQDLYAQGQKVRKELAIPGPLP